MLRPSWKALQAQVELTQLLGAAPGARVAQLLPGPQVVQAAQLERQASQPLVAQSSDAQQERAPERKPEWAVLTELREQQASPQEQQLWASAEPPAARDAAVAQPQLPSSA